MKRIVVICFIVLFNCLAYSEETIEKINVVEGDINETVETEQVSKYEEKTDDLLVVKESDIEKKESNKNEINKFIRIKGNFGLPGEVAGKAYNSVETEKLCNLQSGVEAMMEGVYRISSKAEVAVGIGVQVIGYLDTSYGVQENNYAVPFYFSGKYNLWGSSIYLKGIIGVTANLGTDDLKYFVASQENPAWGISQDDIEIKNGMYGALGIGLDVWKFEIEGLYSINTISTNFSYDSVTYKRDLQNHRITIGASYAFDWN